MNLIAGDILLTDSHSFASAATCLIKEGEKGCIQWRLDMFDELLELLRCPGVHFFFIFFAQLKRLEDDSGIVDTVDLLCKAEHFFDVEFHDSSFSLPADLI